MTSRIDQVLEKVSKIILLSYLLLAILGLSIYSFFNFIVPMEALVSGNPGCYYTQHMMGYVQCEGFVGAGLAGLLLMAPISLFFGSVFIVLVGFSNEYFLMALVLSVLLLFLIGYYPAKVLIRVLHKT